MFLDWLEGYQDDCHIDVASCALCALHKFTAVGLSWTAAFSTKSNHFQEDECYTHNNVEPSYGPEVAYREL